MISLLLIGGIMFGIAIIVAGVMFIMVASKFDFKCDVLEEMNNGLVLIMEGEKIKIQRKKNEVDKWIIKGWRSIKPFQPFGANLSVPVMGKKIKKVYLFRDGQGQFHIIGFDYNEERRQIVMKPWYRDGLDWGVNELEEREKLNAKKDWVSANLPMWVSIIALMIITMVLIFVPKWVGEQIDKGVAANVRLIELTKSPGTIGVTTIPTTANSQTLNWTTSVIPISGGG